MLDIDPFDGMRSQVKWFRWRGNKHLKTFKSFVDEKLQSSKQFVAEFLKCLRTEKTQVWVQEQKKRERGRRMFFAQTSFLTPSPPPPTLNSPHPTLKKFQWTFLRSQFCFLKSSACFLFVIKRHLRFSICFYFLLFTFLWRRQKNEKAGKTKSHKGEV